MLEVVIMGVTSQIQGSKMKMASTSMTLTMMSSSKRWVFTFHRGTRKHFSCI